MTQLLNRVAFLATGSEIVSGEITNTNSPAMAQILLEHGILSGDHLCVDDDPDNLTAGLNYLADRHRVVITSGGLGPTADDRTRNHIASRFGLQLVKNEESWQRISKRIMEKLGYLPPSNEQQAFFPKGAAIFTNLNGSADGFYVQQAQQIIAALPGPPKECLPIFTEQLLPVLLELPKLRHNGRLYRWQLSNVPEAEIAERINEAVAIPFQQEIAYRASHPILHVKVFLTDDDGNRDIILRTIDELVKIHAISRPNF